MNITARQKVRNHVFYELTRSLCPECRQVVDAQVLIRDRAVYLRKYCPEHGWHEALVSSDVDWYLNSLKFNKPGSIPQDFTMKVKEGCPHDCGLCPEHQQHTCIGVIEITSRCNLICPTCFADAGQGYDLSLPQVEAILNRLMVTEHEPEMVQISGGEPTIHPQILDILKAAKSRNIRHIMLNTNGIRLAQDPDFVHQLAYYEPTIYLQFDGLTAHAYDVLRGRDLLAIKQKALDHLAEAGMHAILVATIVQGINDSEISDILRYGLRHPAVLGISYQPVTFCGRSQGKPDPLHRITLPDVLHNLEAQTGGMFRISDFFPVPCPHPTCSACTYAFKDGDQVIPITRFVNVEDYLDFITNRTVIDFSEEIKSALESLWSMATIMGGEKTTNVLSCATCNLSLPSLDYQSLKERFFMVQVHGFMDEYSFDLKRLMKCCVHQLLPDGRAIPLCAYNNLGYRQKMKEEA
ncbi:MAG TPA: radical SAM protein [Dehalococcoidia bacterium]|nr:radical SAM protein [Dehalococcoidia bacterium]